MKLPSRRWVKSGRPSWVLLIAIEMSTRLTPLTWESLGLYSVWLIDRVLCYSQEDIGMIDSLVMMTLELTFANTFFMSTTLEMMQIDFFTNWWLGNLDLIWSQMPIKSFNLSVFCSERPNVRCRWYHHRWNKKIITWKRIHDYVSKRKYASYIW